MFLVRTVFWLAAVVLVVPHGSEEPATTVRAEAPAIDGQPSRYRSVADDRSTDGDVLGTARDRPAAALDI